jgi:hypothetical protein
MAPLLTVPVSRPLTLTDRIICQTTIAQVYWDATLWPEANPQPKPALNDVLSAAALEAQVVDSLAQSVALETLWQQPITGAMLQAEMERMATHTQNPEQLRALFAALGNDPAKIAECLVRPQLAERLIRQQFGYDAQRHADTRQQALTALDQVAAAAELTALPNAQPLMWVVGDPKTETLADGLVLEADVLAQRVQELRQVFALSADEPLPLNQISALQEDETRFYVVTILAQSEDRLQLVYAEWPKQTWATWWQANQVTAMPCLR